MLKNDGILENNNKACELLNKKERSARKTINDLICVGKIQREGSDKEGFWKII